MSWSVTLSDTPRSSRAGHDDEVTWDGDDYQRQFDELAASGVDVHGEVDFVMAWAPTSALDAGCGTGRAARELAHRGVDVVGADVDESMIATARRLTPELTWVVTDLRDLDLGRTFDVVLMAGNVPLFTPAGTQPALVAGCARHVHPDGALIAGFQLDDRYSIEAYDEDCAAAGLELVERWATWDREPFTTTSTYAVSVHRPRST